MIKTIKAILKYTLLIAVGIVGLYALTWLLASMDWSLFKWSSALFSDIQWDIMAIFNYPNTWIFISYIFGRDLIFLGLAMIIKRGKKA